MDQIACQKHWLLGLHHTKKIWPLWLFIWNFVACTSKCPLERRQKRQIGQAQWVIKLHRYLWYCLIRATFYIFIYAMGSEIGNVPKILPWTVRILFHWSAHFGDGSMLAPSKTWSPFKKLLKRFLTLPRLAPRFAASPSYIIIPVPAFICNMNEEQYVSETAPLTLEDICSQMSLLHINWNISLCNFSPLIPILISQTTKNTFLMSEPLFSLCKLNIMFLNFSSFF